MSRTSKKQDNPVGAEIVIPEPEPITKTKKTKPITKVDDWGVVGNSNNFIPITVNDYSKEQIEKDLIKLTKSIEKLQKLIDDHSEVVEKQKQLLQEQQQRFNQLQDLSQRI